MVIEYRELRSEDDFQQCLVLQKDIFHFSDTDLVSPLLLKLIARDNPPIGISLGVFRNNELIGILLSFGTFIEKSVYVVLLGIKPEYTNNIYGYKLLLKFREIALSKNIETMYGVYDAFDSNLGRLYCNGLGFKGIQYISDGNNSNVSDKLYVKWNLNASSTIFKIHQQNKLIFSDIYKNIPIAYNTNLPNETKVIIQIPRESENISLPVAMEHKQKTKNIFIEYINIRKYVVVDCISGKVEGIKRTFYILEKQ
jgi:predicted GNAT superfamily acetyltransferase